MTGKDLSKFFTQKRLHLWGLIILAVGLPTSNFLMSVGVFWLFGNWLLYNSYPKFVIHERFLDLFRNRAAMIVTSIFLLHVVGLAYSSDFEYAFKDLRIKLPLFGLPILLSTSPKLDKKELKTVLYFFFGSVLFASIVCFLIYLRVLPSENYVDDVRDISIFISHIRFALLLCLAIFLMAYLSWVDSVKLRPVYLISILWLMIFLYILESGTGYVIFIFGTFLLLCFSVWRSRNWYLRAGSLAILLLLIGGATYFVKSNWDEYHKVEQDTSNLEEYTVNGEKYVHLRDNPQLENGYYVWLYYAPSEFEEAWNERSQIPIDSTDRKGQPLIGTAMRYLTSKGLRKDREGVYKLTEEDIASIESGDPSVEEPEQGLSRRINTIFFEIDNYMYGGDPSGNSVTQRLEFWKTARSIVESQPVIGVGTGDVQTAFENEYRRSETQLDRSKWFRSHNQFLTIAVAFGLIGLLWFIFALFYPLAIRKELVDYYTIVFIVIATLSFLAEDTLETQAGATFFAFFYSLFLLGRNPE